MAPPAAQQPRAPEAAPEQAPSLKTTCAPEKAGLLDRIQKFIGKVTKVSPVLDLATRSAPIEITIDNPGHLLKSGMFAKVSLAIDQRLNVPVILKEAVIGKEPDTYVYTVENNKAKTRQVSLGIHEGPLYEVAQGLKEGEMVVIMGQQRLYDDAPVMVEIANSNGPGDAK